MVKLAIRANSPLGSFAGGLPETRVRWVKGEVRDVSDGSAAYLLESFPDVFEEVAAVAAAVEAPAVDKAMKAPKKKTAPKKKATKKAPAKKAKA